MCIEPQARRFVQPNTKNYNISVDQLKEVLRCPSGTVDGNQKPTLVSSSGIAFKFILIMEQKT